MVSSIFFIIALMFAEAATIFILSSFLIALIDNPSNTDSISSLKDAGICFLITIILTVVGVFIC